MPKPKIRPTSMDQETSEHPEAGDQVLDQQTCYLRDAHRCQPATEADDEGTEDSQHSRFRQSKSK